MRPSFFAVLALAVPAHAYAGAYTFTSLSVAGAEASYFGTQAFGINDAGQVVGSFTGSSGLQGFIFDQASATYTTFSDPASPYATAAQAINDSGQVVGYLPYLSDGRIFLRDPVSGTFTSIATPPDQMSATATGINDAGRILGFYTDGNYGNPAVTSFVRDPVTSATTYYQDPDSGSATMPNFTLATAINNIGQVAGYYDDADGIYDGFVLDLASGTYTTLSYAPGVNTIVQGINNSGQVVGYYYSGQITESFVLDLATGIYTPLNEPGAVATFAEGINDAGQIVGSFTDSQNVRNAFLATPTLSATVPVPEPASLALLGVGVFGLAVARHRRNKAG